MADQDKAARDRPPPPREPSRFAYNEPRSLGASAASPPSASEPSRFGYPGPRPEVSSSAASTASAGQHAHSHTHPPGPHHHHHRHHHHHSVPHTAAGATERERERERDQRDRERQPAPQAQPAHERGVPGFQVRDSGTASMMGRGSFNPPPTGYPFATYMADKRERERLRGIDRERERQAKPSTGPEGPGPETSPGRSSAYPHSVLPSTSPTLSRANPPNAAPPKTSAPPPPPSSASAQRPGVPLPSFASLSRPLGSAYDGGGRSRSGSNASAGGDKAAPGHQRTLSSSSTPREGISGLSSIGQTSPSKTTVPPPSQAGRGMFGGGPPPLSNPSRDQPPPQRSPVQQSHPSASPTQTSREPPSNAPKPPASSSSAAGGRPPYSFSSTYASAYTQPYSSYGGIGGGSFLGSGGGYPFAFGAQERERRERDQREREKERDQREREREQRDREQRDRDQREQREKERERELEREREREREKERQLAREREDRARFEKEQQQRRAVYGVETKPFQPPRQPSTAYTDIYRQQRAPQPPLQQQQQQQTQQQPQQQQPQQPQQPQSQPQQPQQQPMYTRHIEVINRPDTYAAEKAAAAPPPAAAAQPPALPPAAPPPAERRQYGYTKPETEYTYTPRESAKRPRADAAAEEPAPAATTTTTARRGGGRKRRKEEEKPAPRDWSALTVAVKKWPEVSSAPVEAWLKSLPMSNVDLGRVVGNEVYRGSSWSLAQTRSSCHANEGGLVVVRVGGGFLGTRWKVRGEPGWDEARPAGTEGAVVGLGWGEGGQARTERRIWGTDVYTDDSDLGLVLVHAGWIRWGGAATRSDNDVVNVTVRIVPRLVRYTATERNGVVTRGWGNGHDGASIVVEGVERIKVDKKFISRIPKRAARKLFMAELQRQREAELGWAPLHEDVAASAGVLPQDLAVDAEDAAALAAENGDLPPPIPGQMIFLSGQAGFAYAPDMLGGWVDVPGDERGEQSLWTHDLEFGTADDKYKISLRPTDHGAPRLHIKAGDEMLAEALEPRAAHWVAQGLALQLDADKGVLCPADVFRWVERSASLGAEDNDDVPMDGKNGTEAPADDKAGDEVAPNGKDASVPPNGKVGDDDQPIVTDDAPLSTTAKLEPDVSEPSDGSKLAPEVQTAKARDSVEKTSEPAGEAMQASDKDDVSAKADVPSDVTDKPRDKSEAVEQPTGDKTDKPEAEGDKAGDDKAERAGPQPEPEAKSEPESEPMVIDEPSEPEAEAEAKDAPAPEHTITAVDKTVKQDSPAATVTVPAAEAEDTADKMDVDPAPVIPAAEDSPAEVVQAKSVGVDDVPKESGEEPSAHAASPVGASADTSAPPAPPA